MSDATKLVVFDCDGTLVDSQYRIVICAQRAFAEHGLPEPTAQMVRSGVGLPLEVALMRIMPEERQGDFEAVTASYRKIAYDIAEQNLYPEALYPNLVNCLQSLKSQGIAMGVATGKSRRGLKRTLDHFELNDFFYVTKTVEDGPGKPAPNILLDAIAELGASPETTVMVGDTTFDMEMGNRANCHTIGVNWGYHDVEDLIATGANFLATDYNEIPGFVSKALGIKT